MPRSSRTGVRGLYGSAKAGFRFDFRWLDGATGEYRRFRQGLPPGTSSAAAKKWASDLMSQIVSGHFDPTRREIPRLKAAFGEYEEWLRSNVPAAVSDRGRHARQIVGILGDIPLDQLSPISVQKLKKVRTEAGVKPATVNRLLATLKHMVGLAAREWGWIGRDQAAAIRDVKLLREPPGRVRYLKGDEHQRLLAALPEWLLPLVQLSLLTGMRQGEIRTLRWSSVDLETRVITLIKTKGNKVVRVHFAPEALPIFQAQIGSGNPYVFYRETGEPYSKAQVTHAFRRARQACGIDDLRFHDARHDFASRLASAGTQLQAIQHQLGHSNISMTSRYAHLSDDVQRQAVRHAVRSA